jgi:hypothetical protein
VPEELPQALPVPPAHLDGRAGLVPGLEVSRLAGDRHQPIELLLAGRVLLNDADGIYDPNWYNDRLLLELKRHDERSVMPTSADIFVRTLPLCRGDAVGAPGSFLGCRQAGIITEG